MAEDIVKTRTIIILIIGALIILALSYACVLDWINKLENGEGWLVNMIYHPLTGVISIIFFTLAIVFSLEKSTPGRMEKIKSYLEKNRNVFLIVIIITIVSLILLAVNSLQLLAAGTSGIEALVAVHTLLGILFGVTLFISCSKIIIGLYLSNPEKWQKVIIFEVIIAIVAFTIIVIIGRAIGLISI
jgi:hypothetical protein